MKLSYLYFLFIFFLFFSCNSISNISKNFNTETVLYEKELPKTDKISFLESKTKRIFFDKTEKPVEPIYNFLTLRGWYTYEWNGSIKFQNKIVDLGLRIHFNSPILTSSTQESFSYILKPVIYNDLKLKMKKEIGNQTSLAYGTEIFKTFIGDEKYSIQITDRLGLGEINPISSPKRAVLEIKNSKDELIAILYSEEKFLDTYWLNDEEKNSFEIQIILGFLKGFLSVTYGFMKL